MVELRDERMLEPIDEHFRNHHGEHRLEDRDGYIVSKFEIMVGYKDD